MDARFQFLSRGKGYGLFLAADEAILRLTARHDTTIRMKLVGGLANPRLQGMEPNSTRINYLMGADVRSWHGDIATYSKVRYSSVYPGIDLTYYGNQQRLEYDFTLAPHANPEVISLRFDGLRKISIDRSGNLVLKTAAGEIRQPKPVIYQEGDGGRLPVDGSYVLRDHHTVGFRIGSYDPAKQLIIDPVLVYSTYFGGTSSAGDQANAIAVDPAGNVYVTGQTSSTDLLLVNAGQNTLLGATDGFVLKLDSSGTNVIYSTYFGGNSNEEGHSIAVDAAGNAYVTGFTSSNNFPTTANAFQPAQAANQETFLLKLDPAGGMAYSTYLGGNGDDRGLGVALDPKGGIYVTGLTGSTDFPVASAYQSANAGGLADVFVTKFGPSGTLQYSTYVGGRGNDQPYGIAVDSSGAAYVAGYTTSANLVNGVHFDGGFPTVVPFQADFGGGSDDAFVFKLSPAGNALQYSTFLGGAGSENATRIAVNNEGMACLTGYTNSDVYPGTHQIQFVLIGGYDAFITCMAPDGQTLTFSTYLGGEGNDSGTGIAFDSEGNLYVGGYTESAFLQTVNATQTNFAGVRDGFIAKVDPVAPSINFQTYIGGSDADGILGLALDPAGNPYVVGFTASTDFPVLNAFQPQNNGGNDAFIAKINTSDIISHSDFAVSPDSGISLKSTGDRTNSVFGYATADSNTPINGMALLEFRNFNGLMVSQTGVLAPPLREVGRLFIEVTATVRSVISIANPSDEDASVDFFTTDQDGNGDHFATVSVPAHTHFSRFLTDDPFNIVADFAGTLNYTSSIPVAATAFRTINNERSDFLISSTPIADPIKGVSDQPIVIPELADGANWTSQVILVNTTEERMNGEVRFFSQGNAQQPGAPMLVGIGGESDAVQEYDIPPRSFQRIQTSGIPVKSDFPFKTNNGFEFSSTGLSGTQSMGFATATSGSVPLNGLQILEYAGNGTVLSETGLQAPPLRLTGMAFVETTGTIRTVISIVNPTDNDANVDMVFTDQNGAAMAPVNYTVSGHTQLSQAMAEVPLSIPLDTPGTITFTSNVPVSAIVLRYIVTESGDTIISSTPIVDPDQTTNQPAVIPYFSDGDGTTSSVVLVNNSAEQMNGEVRFFSPGDGNSPATPMSVGIGDGSTASSVLEYDIPPRSSQRIQTSGTPLRSDFPFAAKPAYTFQTTGQTTDQNTTYAIARSAAPNAPLSGLRILEHTEFGVTVTEAASLPAPLRQYGRLFVEATSNVHSLIAIVNPSDTDATVDFFFTDDTGAPNFFRTVSVPAHSQFSNFIDAEPLSVVPDYAGTLNFSSSVPVAADAFRYLTNETGNTVISATPIADPLKPATGMTLIPNFADGGGWNSQIVLVNTTESEMQGEIRFYSGGNATAPGMPVLVAIGSADTFASVVGYDIPPRSFNRIQTAGAATALTVGSIQVVPFAGSTPHAHAIMTYRADNGTALSQTPIEAQVPTSNLRLYVEDSGDFYAGRNGSVRTAVAIANPSSSFSTVRISVTTLDGVLIGTSNDISIAANGQIALFLDQFSGLQALPNNFQGIAQVTPVSGPGVTAIAVLEKFNSQVQRLVATTGPLIQETSGSTLVFPYVPDGDGYTSRVITMGAQAAQSISGVLSFFASDGSSMNMDELRTGSVYIVPSAGTKTPQAHVALTGRHVGNTVFETPIEARPAATSFRLYAEAQGDFQSHASGSTNTAVAIANPSGSPATVSFDLIQLDGTSLGTSGNIVVPPNGQVLVHLNEIPGFQSFNSVQGFLRLTTTSANGVVAAGFRSLYNSREDLLEATTGPLYENATAPLQLVLPSVFDGAGYFTHVVVTSGSTPQSTSGVVQFFNADGSELNMDEMRVGSVHVVPFPGTMTPQAHIVLTYVQNGVTVLQTPVDGQQPANTLRFYAEASGDFDRGAIQSRRTSVAIANPSESAASVRLELRTFDGRSFASSPITIPGNGQVAKFLNQIPGLESLPAGFQGVLRVVDVSGSGTTAAAFRTLYNEGGEFLATPTGPLNEDASANELIFPHIADGGGYTTTFIVVNGLSGQASSGVLHFITQQGTPLGFTFSQQ